MDGARFGLTHQHVDILTRVLFDPLRTAGFRVGIFGSRARGVQAAFSDIDVLIQGTPCADLVARVREQLEESTLPYRVDLVEERDLAASYRDSVMQDIVWLWD
jgi:hypothetical protein